MISTGKSNIYNKLKTQRVIMVYEIILKQLIIATGTLYTHA